MSTIINSQNSQIINSIIAPESEIGWFIDRSPRSVLEINNYIYYNNLQTNIYNNLQTIIYNELPIIYNDFQPVPRAHRVEIQVVELEITEEQQDCCICMEQKEKTDICCLQCPHSFCGDCLTTTLKSYNEVKCPLCRETIQTIRVQTEENREKISEHCFT